MRGSERNQPCPCGSGIKAKRCPGPHAEEIDAANRENADRELVRRLAAFPRNRLSAAVMIAGALSMGGGR